MLRSAVMVGVIVVVSAAPASATLRPIDEGGDTSPCVTYQEVTALQMRIPMRRVKRIVDSRGVRARRKDVQQVAAQFVTLTQGIEPSGVIVRAYPSCYSSAPENRLFVWFSKVLPRHPVQSIFWSGVAD